LCTVVSHSGAQAGDRGQLANDGDTLVGLDTVTKGSAMANTASKALEMSEFDKIGQRRDIALQRLHEYNTAPTAKRDKIDAAHPDGDAYNSLIDEVCLAHITYMFARG
jgi:hypothetical protein